MIPRFLFTVIFLTLIISCSPTTSPTDDEKTRAEIDSILKSPELIPGSREKALNKLLKNVTKDSLMNEYIFKISYHFYSENDSLPFRHWHRMSKKLSVQLKDTSKIAESYWDMGNFMSNNNSLHRAYSNYNKAHNLYNSIGNIYYAARMLSNMAIIQKNVGDLTGSEITSIKAIKIFNDLDKPRHLYSAYNNLGIVYNGLKEYDKALEHHETALTYLKSMEDQKLYRETSLNNIGVVLQNMKNYEESIKKFNKALSRDSLLQKNPSLYAMLLDNRAYSRLHLNDTTGISSDFYRALKIRDSIKYLDGIVINNIHLSEYYAIKEDTSKAISFATEANHLARKTNNNRDVKASLLLLSKLDPQKSSFYLESYIILNDSLQQQERVTRNKFSKIRFDTEQFMAENEELYGQRNVLIGISLGIILFGFSGFVIRNQRSKNRKLLFRQEQQKANEKIYRLLFDQQAIKEEGRQKERQRISEEMHDGILARLFGLRMSLDNLNSKADEKSVELRGNYINDLKGLEKEIRQLSHEFNSTMFTADTNYFSILENILNQQNQNSFSYQLETNEPIDWEKVSGSIKLHFYRILQEAVKNIVNHSGATHIRVKFSREANFLKMLIEDNGYGFDPREESGGIGLKNMRSRAKAMQGTFYLESKIKTGTRILVKVPVEFTEHKILRNIGGLHET